jgi:hypothetical protein
MIRHRCLKPILKTEAKSLRFFRDGPGSWLTARRLRAHGLLFAVTIWSVYIWILATPTLRDRNGNLKGTDFLHFYTLGSLALAHNGAGLYNINAQADLASRKVPDARGIRYLPLYPPQVSILFAPLAHFSYAWALALWWASTAVVYGLCCYGVWRASPNLQRFGGTVALLALGFPAFFQLIAWGQTSALALACFTGAFLLLRVRREFLAGLFLGLLIFKPQLGIAAAIVFLFLGAWRIVIGAILAAAAQIAAGIAYYGIAPFRSWLHTLWEVPALLPAFEPRPYQTHCLRTFWTMIVPWDGLALGLYAISGVSVLICTVWIWRREQSIFLRYAALLLATVLVSPHLTVYDLVIVAPVFLLIADWLRTPSFPSSSVGTLLYLVYGLPLIGPLTRWTHVQLSVVAMAALLFWIWRIARSSVLPRSQHNEQVSTGIPL